MGRKSTAEISHQLALSVAELGQLIGLSASSIRERLVDERCEPVKVSDLPADGKAWVRFQGALIPGRKDQDGHLRFLRRDVSAALDDARLYHR